MPQVQEDPGCEITLVALGGNATSPRGGSRDTVIAALSELKSRFGDLEVSGLYQTPAFPAGSGPDFVNAACAFHSDLGAADVLAALHQIEADFGRLRQERWGARTLDLDLIAVGADIQPDPATFDQWFGLPLEVQKVETPSELILPHPRLQDRAFVLVPLADIAPNWVHPVFGKTIRQMLDDLPDTAIAEIIAL